MFFQKKIGLDLGTANTLVYVVGEGIVLHEPTVVAYSLEDKRIVAVGEEAREMLGRTPGSIIASRPMKEGVIADYRTTAAMITYFLKKALKGRVFWPQMVISIPGGASQVEKRAVVSACKQAGASDVYLMEESLAAAIGAKIPISQASGNMIVNIGGGTTEVAIISLGQLVAYKTVRVAGTKFDEAILNHMRKKHNLIIGERTAEDIKIKIGNALIEPFSTSAVEERSGKTAEVNKVGEKTMEVKGRDLITGVPKTVSLTSLEVNEALLETIGAIVEVVRIALENTDPEVASDLVDKGIVMAGGGSLLHGLDKLLSKDTGLPVRIAEDPLLCVVKGAGKVLENFDFYREALM